MIKFNNLCKDSPYRIFKENYDAAIKASQLNIEALCVSSYSSGQNEVNSRFVNLKEINYDEFIFYSNYNSPKAKEFMNHNQISATIFWSNINIQIRMKAIIKKTPKEFNHAYFFTRDTKKNALAISSMQSRKIKSYNDVKENYMNSLKHDDLKSCPDYWGGFSFVPYYFEFWKGDESRINRREVYENSQGKWIHSFLQP